MNNKSCIKSGPEHLATFLVQDMRQRGLTPGDKYLIAREVGSLFEVSTVTAHRALKILADKNVLVRRRKSGTFVGPGFKVDPDMNASLFETIHVLMAMDYYKTSGITGNIFVDTITSALPGTAVQIHYVPEHASLDYTKRIVQQIKTMDRKEGIILIRSTRQMQEFVAGSGIPAIVFGSVYPGINHVISSLDVDQAQSGRLMAEYAIRAGHKKFVLLMRSEWRCGDNILLNAVTTRLGESDYNINSLTVVSVHHDIGTISDEVQRLLCETNRATAIFCRGDYYAEIVLNVASDMGFKVGNDVEIFSAAHLRVESHNRYAYITPVDNAQKQIEKLIKLLKDLAMKKVQPGEHVVIPVEIHIPSK